ncbi:hypothetical protein KVR01_011492 [Diaporthe batatas]|uniref:uncharacterized protein n=1 Tax=Diaporthe batatas TaxID=748121 RepID=UPI001D0434A6|nr:uncharacterized protein KVR01_011492 [Diaporthe batatas]KAG8159049.1 hypothetical protein KVR01_011492 [Diaporthe batatas]
MPSITKTVLALFTTLAAIADVAHAGIQSCPGDASTLVGDGRQYSICYGTDYRGETREEIPNIESVRECGLICDGARFSRGWDCTRVSYSPSQLTCYLKVSTGVEWVVDQNYDTAVRT